MQIQQYLQSTWPKTLICLGVIVLIAADLVWIAIYRIFSHPLAKYPGPVLAKLSDLYMVSAAARCRDTYTRHELHRRYGNVVRTGPNELCFADAASIKDIYGQSSEPCLKAPYFYDGFTLTGLHSVFSTTDRVAHARMRRLFAHGFSERGVLSFQREILTTIETYLSIIAAGQTKPIDLHDLTHGLFLDTASQLSFAQSFKVLRDGKNAVVTDIDTYASVAPLFGTFPAARYLPFGRFKAGRDARIRIIQGVQSYLDDFRARLSKGTAESGLLRSMIEARDEGSSPSTRSALSDAEIIENAVTFINAGSGTTASTLIYTIYELGKRQNLQTALEAEIRNAFPDPSIFPDFETANNLVSRRFCLPFRLDCL